MLHCNSTSLKMFALFEAVQCKTSNMFALLIIFNYELCFGRETVCYKKNAEIYAQFIECVAKVMMAM